MAIFSEIEENAFTVNKRIKKSTYKNDSTAIRIQGKLNFYLCPT